MASRPATMREEVAGGEAMPWGSMASVLARGIVVVSAASGGACHGMTADSFTLVSHEPPLAVVSVAAGGRTHRLLAAATGFAVSVLAAGQAPVAAHFASRRRPPGLRQFDGLRWQPGPHSGAPVLTEALAWLDCERRGVLPVGDHVLVVGEVVAACTDTRSDRPLVRWDGHYLEIS